MEKKLYIVVAYNDTYDSEWQNVIAGSFDKVKAEAYAAERQAEYDADRARKEEMYQFQSVFRHMNPQPKITFPDKISIPKWSGVKNKDITPEMRKIRLDIQNANAAQEAKAREPYDEWHRKLQAETDAWILSKGYDPIELHSYNVYGETKHRIEGVDFIE